LAIYHDNPPELAADGVTDDSAALAARLATGGVVRIPPGDYFLSGERAIPLFSRTHVVAQGARFHLPERLGEGRHLTLFRGTDIADFTWEGGTFLGCCFDPDRRENPWAPNACTRAIVVEATEPGACRDLSFREISGRGLAGAVVTVAGAPHPERADEVAVFAERVSVRDCELIECGKFMWDYGYLWQILVWPEDYPAYQRKMAGRHFSGRLRHPVGRLADGEDRVPVALEEPVEDVCFFGDRLPANLVRGKRYHVVEQGEDHLRIAESPGGNPIRFEGDGGPEVQLIHGLHAAFYRLFWPIGCGPGKGAVDLSCCRHTVLTGNRLSARGDTMHLQRCHHNVFVNNTTKGEPDPARGRRSYETGDYERWPEMYFTTHEPGGTYGPLIISDNVFVTGSQAREALHFESGGRDISLTGNHFRGPVRAVEFESGCEGVHKAGNQGSR
jgi:hypothetical protein